jgi:hypothetical protein
MSVFLIVSTIILTFIFIIMMIFFINKEEKEWIFPFIIISMMVCFLLYFVIGSATTHHKISRKVNIEFITESKYETFVRFKEYNKTLILTDRKIQIDIKEHPERFYIVYCYNHYNKVSKKYIRYKDEYETKIISQ